LEKCGTGPELLKRSPTGTDEVAYINGMKPECGRGCGLGRGRVPAWEYACIFPGIVRDNKEFSREKKQNAIV
jgi:hypothetical protein